VILTNELAKNNITNPSLKDVSNAVIAIRQSKLPDPKELGNSGSF
jgi:UDP-N-acetylmuramate dehydrogenase